jgi:hypothetical protein
MHSLTGKLMLAATATALLIGTAAPALAQTAASVPDTAAPSASAVQPMTKAEQKKQAKAQRKAERKAARAKNSAEMKKLEDNGYKPAMNDPNYPQNLQNAEKKANAAGGASQ